MLCLPKFRKNKLCFFFCFLTTLHIVCQYFCSKKGTKYTPENRNHSDHSPQKALLCYQRRQAKNWSTLMTIFLTDCILHIPPPTRKDAPLIYFWPKFGRLELREFKKILSQFNFRFQTATSKLIPLTATYLVGVGSTV